jgi:hypothetical protein
MLTKSPVFTRVFLVSLVCALPVFGEDAKPATAPPAPATAGPVKTLALEVAVVRFKPVKAERLLVGFKDLSGNLPAVIDHLKMEGAVSVLYTGNREVRLEEKSKAKFDALETRPVVLIGKAGAPIPPVTAYGLTLEVTMRGVEPERFALGWEGSVTWSPEIVDAWKGEKFLNFMSGAANIAQKAGNLTGDKEVGASADIGLGFAQLFNPKGASLDNQIYELPVNKTVSLTSSRNCKSGDLIVNSTTAEMGSKEAQTILLLIWPTIVP